jgi:hypothetical protein
MTGRSLEESYEGLADLFAKAIAKQYDIDHSTYARKRHQARRRAA